jgi:hypothetical protein
VGNHIPPSATLSNDLDTEQDDAARPTIQNNSHFFTKACDERTVARPVALCHKDDNAPGKDETRSWPWYLSVQHNLLVREGQGVAPADVKQHRPGRSLADEVAYSLADANTSTSWSAAAP